MIEATILKMLVKISKQLEEIASTQSEVKAEILVLQRQLEAFQEYASTLEDRLTKAGMNPLLN